MPGRYHIEALPTPGRFRRVGKYGIVDSREDCARCSNCVKPRCLHEVHRRESRHNADPDTPLQPLYECRACLSCVQGCTKGLLTLCMNPEYIALGDEYFTPDVLSTTWSQADSGRIPVSGAGYRGRFHGPGFDSIWTDMSEIVRPTRDGIHGRETISTSADVGPKPLRLAFDARGGLLDEPATLIEVGMPALLDVPPWPLGSHDLGRARVRAARALKSLGISRPEPVAGLSREELPFLVPLVQEGRDWPFVEPLLPRIRMLEIADGAGATSLVGRALAHNPRLVVAVRLPFGRSAAERVLAMAASGAKVFHLSADLHGREIGVSQPRHLRDSLRALHGELVAQGVRDELTLIVGGGIALPEHMAKAIICGADLVAVDVALLVALGCRICRGASAEQHTGHCRADLDEIDEEYAARRMINLMAAWHSQLIEVLGAMGIREVRRLRGEVGRAIFREDVEREAFGELSHRHA